MAAALRGAGAIKNYQRTRLKAQHLRALRTALALASELPLSSPGQGGAPWRRAEALGRSYAVACPSSVTGKASCVFHCVLFLFCLLHDHYFYLLTVHRIPHLAKGIHRKQAKPQLLLCVEA